MPLASTRATVTLCRRAILVAIVATLSGCGQPDQPVTRTVAKSADVHPAAPTAPANPAMPASPGLVAQSGSIGKPAFPKAPAGWVEQDPGAMRKGSWKVGAAELAVTAFPGDVGGRMANINRWRGQLGLEPANAEMYDAIAVARVGEIQGEVIDLRSKDGARGTVAILARKGEVSWFLKLSGEAAAVDAARADFLKFAAETRLP